MVFGILAAPYLAPDHTTNSHIPSAYCHHTDLYTGRAVCHVWLGYLGCVFIIIIITDEFSTKSKKNGLLLKTD